MLYVLLVKLILLKVYLSEKLVWIYSVSCTLCIEMAFFWLIFSIILLLFLFVQQGCHTGCLMCISRNISLGIFIWEKWVNLSK